MPDTPKGTHRWIGPFIIEYGGVSLEPGAFLSPSEDDLKDPAMKEFVDSGLLLNLSNLKKDEGGEE